MSSSPGDRPDPQPDRLDWQRTLECPSPGAAGAAARLEDRYELVHRLGEGGMGEVWRAVDRRLERPVAIKRLQADLADSPDAIERFLTEARAVARLNHPNVVQVYDFGYDARGPYLVMELVDGKSLADVLEDSGPMDAARAVALTGQVCDALGSAHDQGIIHRDIKPGNILLTSAGVAKLGDFGLARRQAADYRQTQTGALLGTPAFMAPEQYLDPRRADARSDLWSLAATLYQLVTGQVPRMIVAERLPAPLRPVLARALDDEPDRRYQTAPEFRAALRGVEVQWQAAPAAAYEAPITATVVGAPTPPPVVPRIPATPFSVPGPAQRGGRRWWWTLPVVAVLGLATCAGVVLVPFFYLLRGTSSYTTPPVSAPPGFPMGPASPSANPAQWDPAPFPSGEVPSNAASDQMRAIQEQSRQIQEQTRQFQEETKRRIEESHKRNLERIQDMKNRRTSAPGSGVY